MRGYRVEQGKVYKYCEAEKAYFFVGMLYGRTLEEFIADLNK